MKKNRRAPLPAPARFTREFERNIKRLGCYKAEGITIYAPTNPSGSYRVKATFRGQSRDLRGGKTTESAYSAFLELKSWMLTRQNASWGLPEESHVPLAEALAEYIAMGGREQKWKERTQRDRRRDFNGLSNLAVKQGLSCADLTKNEAREWIDSCAGTSGRGKHLIGLLATFLEWGRMTGYFSADQLEIPKLIAWRPPKGVQYQPPLSRRLQSQRFKGAQESLDGQIPTHGQVNQLATQVALLYRFGEGLIHASANLGTRANETFVFTASQSVGRQGFGNYVDNENGYVIVTSQVNENKRSDYAPTKNDKPRRVVIPPVEMIATEFDLQNWLSIRSQEALEEQALGLNPLALLFPNSDGGTLALNNFSKRVLRPAFKELGWQMEPYKTAHGKTRTMNRFTLHSLRARYGTTAADEWGYSERQLLEQGSWADAATVRRFYVGTSDDTFASVQKVHRELR